MSKFLIILGVSLVLVALVAVIVSFSMAGNKSASAKSGPMSPTVGPTSRPVVSTTSAPTTSAPTTRAPTTSAPTTSAPVNVNISSTYIIPRFPAAQNGQPYLLQNQIMEAPYLGAFNNQSSFAYLSSPDGVYRFYLQADGNLYIFKINVNPWALIWSSNTKNQLELLANTKSSKSINPDPIILRLILNSDGNLVLYYYDLAPNADSTKKASVSAAVGFGSANAQASFNSRDILSYSGLVPLWSTNTQNRGGTRLVMQNDSNLVIYRNSDNTNPVWSTFTGVL